MRIITKSFFTVITSAALGLIFSPSAHAQAFKVEASSPEFDDLQSPQIDAGGVDKGFKPKDWLEVEASFNVQMRPEPISKTADRVLVKWFVAVENPDKRGTYLLLTKDVTHVNVPLNEEIYSSIYLSPASLKRLTGSDRGGKRAVYLVGYEILINGEKVAQETNKSDAGWWNQTSDKIARTDTVPLLNKSETPFANLWWDRYAEILIERR
ncbi:Amuc_1102 family pilus-like protein [Luteolibacter sp. AS25]|uniref:Amuc_1102 family pilus-like protein n=1 Tax=Luteolibacter sp. AS25 TaxID=3135776 RepID=UPI00398BB205